MSAWRTSHPAPQAAVRLGDPTAAPIVGPVHVNSGRRFSPPYSSTDTDAWSNLAVSSWYHIAHDTEIGPVRPASEIGGDTRSCELFFSYVESRSVLKHRSPPAQLDRPATPAP